MQPEALWFPKTSNVLESQTNPETDFKETTHHGNEASDEAEIGEVVGVDGGGGVDLQTVVVLAGVFKQTVHGVENLMGQQEEPLPAAESETAGVRESDRQLLHADIINNYS